MRRHIRILGLFGFYIFLFFPWSIAQGQEKVFVKQIDIKGNRKIEEATIRFKLGTKVGEEFSVERVREDVKTLYKMGVFDDVKVEAEGFEGGLKLTFVVLEKPTIRGIKIEGNKAIKADRIKERIDLVPGGFVDRTAINRAAEKVRLFYEEEGYYTAKVEPEVEPLAEREARVIFKISEGSFFRVEKIHVTGNKGLSEKRIKKAMQTGERFLFWGGILKHSELKADVDRIKALYLDHGYLDIRVEEPHVEVDREKKRIFIQIKVEEGPQYKVGELRVKGNTVFSEEEILSPMRLSKKGRIFSREALQKDIFDLTDRYAEKGYIDVDILPLTDIDAVQRTVDITLDIDEGRPSIVERIEISGNVRTRDKVIRREIKLIEGDIYNSKFLRKGRQNINNLGFFEEVKINTRKGSAPDRLVLDVNVKERPTGAFTFGAGYSSVEGPVMATSLSQANLLGYGQRVSLSAELGTQGRQRYILSFFDPHILDTDTSLGTSLFNTEKVFDRYKEGHTGGSLELGRPLFWEEVRGSLGYRYERLNIFDVAFDAPSLIREQEGKSTTSSLAGTLVRDTRDNRFDPTEGSRHSLSAEYAGGFLGGTNYFTRYIADSSWYYPLFWKFVGLFHGNIGYITPFGGRTLPLAEKFFLGGPATVRGFKYRGLGPLDPAGVPTGGNKRLFFNLELIFPLYEKVIKGSLFFDAGNVWEEGRSYDLGGLRPAAGVGVRIVTPVGPMRLDWGFNLNPRAGEKSSVLTFSVGTFF